ncbi:MAG: sterol desaturase family protein [Candidatus Dormibacteraeota bacterium]|nr:sterol desaturase family protein [Candidatus Dormibacteraeota bacterium]
MTTTVAMADDAAPRTSTLMSAARVFAGYGSPRIMAVVATVTLIARIVVGRWSYGDIAVAGAILIVEPFLEWLIHVYGLHAKPATLFGRKLDPLYARRHRMHHRDPRNVPLVFVPLPVLFGFLIALGAIAYFAFPPVELKLTAYATMTSFLFAYEWTHFLIHSQHVPRSAIFRAIWRNHILHHYKNEQYWFGVTNPLADYALRTNPAKEAVPSSPTARTLGVDDELTLIGSHATA